MADLMFDETHNLVVFLEKPDESDGFEQIVDFLNAHTIKYALTLQALVDKKKVIITESTIRRDLYLEDAEGTECLPTATIFEELTRIGGPIEPVADEAANEESVPTHSNDPLLSGEDRIKLNELMELCTTLQLRVLDLETTKTAQAKEIASLKKRVKKMERKRKSKTPGMKRLFKVDRSPQVISSEDEGLDDQEDASKQERKIADIDADAEEVEVEKVVSTAEVITNSATIITVDELTLAQTLIEIKATKPKVRGVVIQEPTELEEEERLAREREDDINIAEWDNVQAMIDADYELDARLQAQEQEELTIEEKSRLFVELMDKRKTHFAKLKAEKKTTNQSSKLESNVYLSKKMVGFTHNQLKNKSFNEVQKAFDKTMSWIDSFVPMDSEMVKDRAEGSEKRAEDNTKRIGTKLEQEKAKKQKIDDDQEEAEMKKLIEIFPDEEEVAIDAIPLATKPTPIVNFQIHRKGRQGYYEIMRADGSAKTYLLFSQQLKEFDREDLENLWKLVKAKHGNTRQEEGYERVL
ncbi:hypothetical protein Tco_0333210 [Tanacetum coccineum]